MTEMNGNEGHVPAEGAEDDDFDLNTEEIATEDDQTPAASALEQDEDSADVETEDEDLPDDVRLHPAYATAWAQWDWRPALSVGAFFSVPQPTSTCMQNLVSTQGETSMQAKKEIAKREKERLRLQEKQRKANLEKMRNEQDDVAAADDVSS